MDEARQRFIGWGSMHKSFALSLKKAFKVLKHTISSLQQQQKAGQNEENCVNSSWNALRYSIYFQLWLGVRKQ